MRKKLFVLLLAFVSCFLLAVGLVACGDGSESPSGSGQGTTQTPQTPQTPPAIHTHSWSSTYVNDGDRHYQTCNGCAEKQYAEHSYNSIGYCVCGKEKPAEEHVHLWVEEYSPYWENGKHYQRCSGCDKIKLGTCEYTNWQEISFTLHAGECRYCGDQKYEDHTYGNWQEDSESYHKRVCNVCNSEEIDLHQSEGDKCKMCNKDFSNYVQVIVASNGNKYEYKIDEAGHIDLPEDVMTNPTSNVYNRVYSDRACTQPIDDLTFTKRTKVYLARYNVNHLLSYNCTFSVANGQATLTKVVNFVKNQPVIVVPKYYNGFPVTGIGESAFLSGTMREVILLDGITSIGRAAFCACGGLTYITMPSSLISIGQSAFQSCTSLTSITIPNKVTFIDQMAFNNCTSLKSVHITDLAAWCNIKYYTSSGFSHGANPLECAGKLYLNGSLVTELNIPNGVTSIKSCAFEGCTSLTSVIIPNSVTSISSGAFNSCSGLTSVKIGNSVASIGMNAFYGCTNLTSVTIPNSVTQLISSTFGKCVNLNNINYLGTVEQWKAIKKQAFEYGSPIIRAWDDQTGNYVVYCTDGSITKSGEVTYY